MDHTDRFFQDSLPQEASSDRQQYTFASPTTQPNLAATSMSHFSRIYDDRENIDPVTLRSAITGRRVFDREEPSISGSGMPRLVDAEGNDLPQSRSPLPENYPRVPLQDITAVLEQQEHDKARAKVKAAAVAKSIALESTLRVGTTAKTSTGSQQRLHQISRSNSSRSTQLRSIR